MIIQRYESSFSPAKEGWEYTCRALHFSETDSGSEVFAGQLAESLAVWLIILLILKDLLKPTSNIVFYALES